MAVNPYFKSFQNPNEQKLLDSLIQETIKIYGQDIYYLPKTIRNLNAVLGEDPTSTYDAAYVMEMYLENVEGFEGPKTVTSMFGLGIIKKSNFLITNTRFKKIIENGPFNIPPIMNPDDYIRPMEGALLYFPLTRGLFEITKVDHEAVFYQLGRSYVWRLETEMFKYSNEVIQTGIPELDVITSLYTNDDSIENDPLADNDTVKTKLDEILDPNSPTDPFSLGNY